MLNHFAERMQTIQAAKGGDVALMFAPHLLKLPLSIQRFDDPFLPYGKTIINATRDIVCAYVFDLAAYLALGAAGAVALERTIAYVGDDAVTVLHGPFASEDYVEAVSERAFNVDAVTLVKGVKTTPYSAEPKHGAFTVWYDEPQNLWFDRGEVGVYWIDAALLEWYTDSQRSWQAHLIQVSATGEDFEEQIRAECEAARKSA